MFKKTLQFILIVLPMILLLAVSGYFTYNAWLKYQSNSSLSVQLNNAKLLQSLEHSVLNEIVCVATIGNHKKLIKKVCNPTKKTTDAVMQKILQQKEDTSLHELERIIFNIRNSIKDSGSAVVEKLVNGELDKEMNAFLQGYTSKLKKYSEGMDKKEYIRYFADISNITYQTEAEKALVSYYLSLNKAMPDKSLIYWDEIVSKSQIPSLDKNAISILHEDIANILEKDTFQETLRTIEDIRLDIMTHARYGHYKSNIASWINVMNHKQKVLSNVENMLLGHIYNDVSRELENSKKTLLLSLMSLLFSILGLIIFNYLWKKNKSKKKLLDDLMIQISAVSSEKEPLIVKDDIASYKMAYNYISSNYTSIHEKEKFFKQENKINTAFMSNLSYEIRTPLNGISGYTKLLKETSLNAEQNDFIAIIENSYDNLDTILSKLTTDTGAVNQQLEIENILFDVMKKVESAVETFSIKADQKDIVLGLYIDPSIPRKVRGDGTKISQIITNLIDNALEASSAYDSINIALEQIQSDEEYVSVKFTIKDHGLGYSDDEVARISSALDKMELVDNISSLNMKNLTISNKIIKRMGGKLDIQSKKAEGTSFIFTLKFEKDNLLKGETVYPTFEGMKVGLALPSKDIERQIDKNLEMYIQYLGSSVIIYDYETLFENMNEDTLPDILFVYHNYARLEGELEAFSNLPCKVALITSGTLRARIDTGRYNFSSIVYAPITMGKIIKIFTESKVNSIQIIEKKDDKQNEVKQFENIDALVVEDNEISQQLIKSTLEKHGITVSLVSNGEDALKIRQGKKFDIIFMDIEMPMMDGVETASKMLYYEGVNQLSHIPIVALTSALTNLDKTKDGMDAYISTPIIESDLCDVVQKYCIEIPKQMAQSEEDELIAKVLAGDFLKD